MNVNECYQYLLFLMRKNQIGGLTPSEFGIAFNSSQRDFFNTLLGKITIAPHIALGNNARIAERLRPFKFTENRIVSSQVATYPPGFQAITLMTDPIGRAVQYIDDAKLQGRLNSVIDPIAEANPPVFTNTSNGWKVWPETIANVNVSYYKLPPDVRWNYTTGVNNRPVYAPLTSVDPVWDNVSTEEILAKSCT
ncbi:MAG: hypothetical protein WKF91_23585, partial [Segetibacter sp.]